MKPIVALSRGDQAALSWFFTIGVAAFESSPMGPMLQHVELYGCATVKCGGCRGAGIRADGAWCQKCAGTGAFPIALQRDNRSPEELPVHDTRGEGGYVPDDGTMARYAVVSRRVSALPHRLQRALEAFHGPHGSRCDCPQAWRLVALFPLVPAGHRLVRLALDDMHDAEVSERYRSMPAYEQCYWQVAAQRTNRRPQRGALIDAAAEQAGALYVEAASAFMDACKAAGVRSNDW